MTGRLVCFWSVAGVSALLLAGSPCAMQRAYAEEAPVELWQLDCGTMEVDDLSFFSDAFLYKGQPARLVNGCYLVRRGEQYLLWDAGMNLELLGNTKKDDGWLEVVSVSLEDQFKVLGLAPTDIDFLGISHFHGDHLGQAPVFKAATLLMNEKDVAWLRGRPPRNARAHLKTWLEGGSPLTTFRGDHDVFGDGSVVILALPGHTPGHSGLLVRLKETGPVILTGDLHHFHSEIGRRIVSQWNHSRAETLASQERLEALIESLDPLVVVQHDPEDWDKLPTIPESAR